VLAPKSSHPAYPYIYSVREKLYEHWLGPKPAIDGKLTGRLMVRLTLNASGEIQTIDVVKSSGEAVLDEDALSVIRAAGPFGPFPPEIQQPTLQIDLTLIYD
jgi:periplasmic protein TonB